MGEKCKETRVIDCSKGVMSNDQDRNGRDCSRLIKAHQKLGTCAELANSFLFGEDSLLLGKLKNQSNMGGLGLFVITFDCDILLLPALRFRY
ncbi:hypothetical protein EPI10_003000 [Gossypium australe]|uniref:Uncharacterized protein n=1 Tax=Gossypium australe TaxID=47621 RepID=A0A5B6VGC4_9ROSI|nr:hypothetical protein EPI10_003000 [Gossypium australe]